MPPKKDIDIDELKNAYDQLKSVAKIAKQFKVAPETIRVRLIAAGVELRPKGRPLIGEQQMDSAERVRRHRSRKQKASSDPKSDPQDLK